MTSKAIAIYDQLSANSGDRRLRPLAVAVADPEGEGGARGGEKAKPEEADLGVEELEIERGDDEADEVAGDPRQRQERDGGNPGAVS